MVNVVKLFWYVLLLLIPFAVIGVLSREGIDVISKDNAVDYFGILIIFYIPLVSYLRVRSLGYGFKEFLLSLIPYYGWKYYFKEKEKEKTEEDEL